MVRAIYHSLVVAVALACVGVPAVPAYAAHETSMGGNDWSHAYVLTPLEHKRLRAKGLTDKEVFAAANIAHITGWSIDEVVNMIVRGETVAMISERTNIPAATITHEEPEWSTPEWKAAVERGDYIWVAPRTYGMRDNREMRENRERRENREMRENREQSR